MISGLDAEELLYLGMHATRNNDARQGIECLKRCLELDPNSSRAMCLLGALYAQIGLYDRAKETLEHAIELDPGQHTAAFQLGLLHVTSGDVAKAEAAWNALDSLDEAHFLQLFRRGLLALVADHFQESAELLARGIAANTVNEPLNDDMRALQASAEASAQRVGTEVPAGNVPVGEGHHHLGAYQQRNRQ
jgi:tetratricopeptide (TPR) repeat protein